MSTRYCSLLIYLFAMALPSLNFLPPAHAMEKGTTNKPMQSNPSIQTEKLHLTLDTESLQQAQTAAFKGLKTMILQLVKADALDEKHARDLGLEPNDLVALTGSIGDQKILSDAIRIFHVSLRDLRDFAPGQTERNLLIDTQQLLFPVKIGNDERFSVTVRAITSHTKGTAEHQAQRISWRPTKWGLPNLTRRLRSQQKCVNDSSSNIKEFSLVSIPSLNRNFLGYEDNGEIKLISLVSDQGCEPGKPLSANKVFLDLVQEAKGVGDSPR